MEYFFQAIAIQTFDKYHVRHSVIQTYTTYAYTLVREHKPGRNNGS